LKKKARGIYISGKWKISSSYDLRRTV